MAVVNFNITKPFEEKVNQTIKKQGFTSKAEFFRFVAWYYMQEDNKSQLTEDEEFSLAAQSLAKTVRELYAGKELPSLEEQMADV